MVFQFLGTSAGEEFPALWCSCETCSSARSRGRNIRRNSCAVLFPLTGIDFGPGVFHQAQLCGVDLLCLENLFITHCHRDHLYPTHLFWRRMRPDQELPPVETAVGPRFSPLGMLHVYGGSDLRTTLEEYAAESGLISPYCPEGRDLYRLTMHEVAYGKQTAAQGGLTFVALEANHTDRTHNAVNYIFHCDGRNILYAIDTGLFLEHTYDIVRQYRYAFIVLDLTFGTSRGTSRHLNLAQFRQVRSRLLSDGLLEPNGIICASHIGPHFAPIHDEYAPLLKAEGITVAYDGLKLEL